VLDGLGVGYAGAFELPFKAACAAKDPSEHGRRHRSEIFPYRGRQRLAKLTRVKRRVGVGPAQRGERDDRTITDSVLEQPVEFAESGADVTAVDLTDWAVATTRQPVVQDAATLLSQLQTAHVSVSDGGQVRETFFSVTGTTLIANGERVEVFEYTTPAAASAVILVVFVGLMVAAMMRVVDVRRELVK